MEKGTRDNPARPELCCAPHGCALRVGPRVAAWQGKRYSFTLPSEAPLHLPGPICQKHPQHRAVVSSTGVPHRNMSPACHSRARGCKPQGQFPWFLTRPHGVKPHKRKGFCCPVIRLSAKVEESKQWCVKGKPFIQTTLQTEIRVRPRYPRSQSSGQPQAGSWEAQF